MIFLNSKKKEERTTHSQPFASVFFIPSLFHSLNDLSFLLSHSLDNQRIVCVRVCWCCTVLMSCIFSWHIFFIFKSADDTVRMLYTRNVECKYTHTYNIWCSVLYCGLSSIIRDLPLLLFLNRIEQQLIQKLLSIYNSNDISLCMIPFLRLSQRTQNKSITTLIIWHLVSVCFIFSFLSFISLFSLLQSVIHTITICVPPPPPLPPYIYSGIWLVDFILHSPSSFYIRAR